MLTLLRFIVDDAVKWDFDKDIKKLEDIEYDKVVKKIYNFIEEIKSL